MVIKGVEKKKKTRGDETLDDALSYSCMSWQDEEDGLTSNWSREIRRTRLAAIFVIGLFSLDESRSTGTPLRLEDPR